MGATAWRSSWVRTFVSAHEAWARGRPAVVVVVVVTVTVRVTVAAAAAAAVVVVPLRCARARAQPLSVSCSTRKGTLRRARRSCAVDPFSRIDRNSCEPAR